MSYEVLARRWRPQSFADVAGQDHVTTTLRNAIESQKLPHALLLCGPRGVGKTSIARILARALNCDQGAGTEPCGECRSCSDIANSTSLDVQEIDAASHTGVENVREIRDSIRYAAAPGKHRIFIIDEVHMLSQAAFNALLKTLEEPPPNSLFVFATTDPQKIPDTVLSRVQRFDLKRLGAGDVFHLLQTICKSEKLSVPDAVLRWLVREAEGSARDSLTLLDRLQSGLGKKISEEDAAAVLGLVDRRLLSQIVDSILERDPGSALLATRAALDKGIEANRLAADLLAEFRNLLVARISEKPEDLIELAPEDVADLKRRAEPHSEESFQRMYRVLLTRTQDLTFAPRPGQVLEMACVRLATLPETAALAEVLRRIEMLEKSKGGGGPPSASGGSSGGGARKVAAPAGSKAERKQAGPHAEARPATPELESPREAAAATPSAPAAATPFARKRDQIRNHPAVELAIEILDAELRDVKLPRA